MLSIFQRTNENISNHIDFGLLATQKKYQNALTILITRDVISSTKNWQELKNYCFTSSYPHHDIYTFCYWQIFWHSIWHIFWHSIWHSTWHIFCNMFCHIFWHSIWHIFRHIFWHSIWHSLWQIFWQMFWQTFWHFIWHTFWHSIWHTFWHSIWQIFWHMFWQTFWHFIWHTFWHSIWPLRSSGAHWARQVPGWGPAVCTELGRSQVEVQRCALSWEGPRLRSSGAHWAGKVPGWGPAVRTELGRSQVEVQQCALSWEVGEELGEELARRKWRWKLMQTWSRRNWRRRRRRRRRRTTALIKSSYPHLAGGEKNKNETETQQTNLFTYVTTKPFKCAYV